MMKQLGMNAFFSIQKKDSRTYSGPVFVVGTGRSGTHFLCACLNKFDGLCDYFGGKESPWIFNYIANLTVNQKKLNRPVIGYFRFMQRKVHPAVFLDQSHPNVWHVEQLLEQFPSAKFIAISRNVYSVIYSMKRHQGVSQWILDHNKYPKPNSFLGITPINRNIYEDSLSNVQRAVFRWCAHEERIKQLVSQYPGSVISIKYEDLASDMRGQMSVIADFLGISPPERYEAFNHDSLQKKLKLTEKEVAEIDTALKIYETN